MTDDRVIAWLRVARLRGVGPVLVKRLLEALGTPEAILRAQGSRLSAIEGIGTVKANQILASVEATEAEARAELARAQENEITILGLDDPRYPPALKTVADPPVVLYVRGDLMPGDAVALGVVGARQCTLYGREQAQRIAAQLAQRGLTIISGGARGIDTAAHLGALQACGRTLVVAGCGLLNTYPPENESLYERIVKEGRGAILSELPLDVPPAKENFPPRNRIIAGMSLGILVVEANLQSGSLITARLASGDYGREVFALPGRVDSAASAGTHELIKAATAHLVEGAEDILRHLGDVGRTLERAEQVMEKARVEEEGLFRDAGYGEEEIEEPPPEAPLTATQEMILASMPAAGITIDDLVEATRLAPQVVMAELTLLQIRKKVARLRNNRFAVVGKGAA